MKLEREIPKGCLILILTVISILAVITALSPILWSMLWRDS